MVLDEFTAGISDGLECFKQVFKLDGLISSASVAYVVLNVNWS